MRSQFVFKFTHFLFHRFYWLYKPLYFAFKKWQDKHEIQLIQSMVKEGDTILDIGANIGFYSTLFSDWVGQSGKIYCFEPDKNNFQRLLQTVKNKTNILLKNAAVGSYTGTLDFYTSPDKNVDHRAYRPETYANKYSVECICLDDFPGADSRIDILKVDVQGFEMQVYTGAEKLLKSNPEIKIFSEFWPYGLEKAGSNKNAFFDFFNAKGFSIYWLNAKEQILITKESLNSFKVDESNYYNVFIQKESN